jgi:nucleotide-binding universal stress UspA family protein
MTMFDRIMVPLNGHPSAEAAVAPAAAMARMHGAELHLVLVDGVSRLDPMPCGFMRVDCSTYRDERVRPIANRLRNDQGIAVTTAMLTGRVVDVLANYASSVRADLIMMATHARVGWRRAWVGSVADDLMHKSAVPLLLLRAGNANASIPGPFRRILVALDGSAAAEHALDEARNVARPGKATLILAQVVTPIPVEVNVAVIAGVVLTDGEATQSAVDVAHRYLDNLADFVRSREAIPVETVVALAPPITMISPVGPTLAEITNDARADLVALTTHGRGMSRLLVGSVADKVLRDTHCPLLICHVPVTAPVAATTTTASVRLASSAVR